VTRRLDRETLRLLDRTREVEIVTVRPDGRHAQTTIWVVVDEDEAYIRSYRGSGALWYRDVVERPDIQLLADGMRLRIRAVPATDDLSIARCSSALERKYAGDPSTDAMVDEEILDTTLRLEPRR
jgi:hypothetical protein